MRSNINRILCWMGILALTALSGCSGGAEPLPAPTDTSIPPSPTPEPAFEIFFDGTECTMSGPEEVEAGYIYVAFDGGGDRNFGPWADQFLEGKTFEDFLREVHTGPEEAHPEPDWVKHPFYFTKDYQVWGIKVTEPGEYGLFVGSYTPWLEYPCGPFRVVPAATE